MVQLSVISVRGQEKHKFDGVAEIKLVNPRGDRELISCLLAANGPGGQIKWKHLRGIGKATTYWFNGLSYGTWIFSADCTNGGGSDITSVDVGYSGENWDPRVDDARFTCDAHGISSFGVRYTNEMSTISDKYWIEFHGVRQQVHVVKGSHGMSTGIDGIFDRSTVTVVAKADTGAQQQRSWGFKPPRCEAVGKRMPCPKWAPCPPKYTCVVLNRPGRCDNNGMVSEGYMDGCVTDLQGVKWWAYMHTWIRSGGMKHIFHKPVLDWYTFWNKHDLPLQDFTYDAGRQESANRVTFSVIRDVHTPRARVVRAAYGCTCPSDGECKKSSHPVAERITPFEESN